MKIKNKVGPIVDTRQNQKWDLNRNIRLTHARSKVKEHDRNISHENEKMFKRLYSIVQRPHPLKSNKGVAGPNTLNMVKRKFELKRIMKCNKEILKNIKEAKPWVQINHLKKRFEETEKYKDIARMYTEYGKREDPVERKMNELYYDIPSPRKKILIPKSKSSFKIRVRRHQSIDGKHNRISTNHPYNHNGSLSPRTTNNRDQLNKSTILPQIDNFRGKIITSSEYNKMVTEEMSMIRRIRKQRHGAWSSMQRIFKNLGDQSLNTYNSNKSLDLTAK